MKILIMLFIIILITVSFFFYLFIVDEINEYKEVSFEMNNSYLYTNIDKSIFL